MPDRKSIIGKVLSPGERFSEVLFGLIMTLSITGTMSVVAEGHQEVGTTLLGALGCNVAWGIIDGILYVLGTASERGREYALRAFLKRTSDREASRKAIEEALPSVVFDVLRPEELENVRQRLAQLPLQRPPRLIQKQDLLGALGVFILVVLSCVPLIIPFLLIHDPRPALRVSNGVAIVMLFLGGYFLAKYAETPRIRTGLVMVALGIVLVGLTIVLGG